MHSGPECRSRSLVLEIYCCCVSIGIAYLSTNEAEWRDARVLGANLPCRKLPWHLLCASLRIVFAHHLLCASTRKADKHFNHAQYSHCAHTLQVQSATKCQLCRADSWPETWLSVKDESNLLSMEKFCRAPRLHRAQICPRSKVRGRSRTRHECPYVLDATSPARMLE